MWSTLIGEEVKRHEREMKVDRNMELYKVVKQYHDICKKQDKDVKEVY